MRQLLVMLLALGVSCSSGEDGDPDALPSEDADLADGQDGSDRDAGTDSDLAIDADEEVIADGGDTEPDRCDIASIVASISVDRMRETISELTSLPERSSYANQQAALAMLQRRLDDLGVPHGVHDYTWAGQSWSNLEIVIPGEDLSTEVYTAGAHYDSTSDTPGNAPGADDNASGTAGILELARVLSPCSFRRTIRLLVFSNEEAGAVGSSYYASDASFRGDDIRGYLNLDMIAYGPSDEDLDLSTRPAHAWLVERVIAANERWVGLDTVTHIDDHCG